MTPQERQLLESLAARVSGTPVPQKDPEADALIRQRLGSSPDALYVLTQTVLIQEMALNQANARLHELTQHPDPAQQQPTSFLGRLFGTGASSRPAPPPSYAAPQYPPPPQYQDAYPPPPPYYQPAPGGGSSFLRSAAATATGVAAGALAFEGIESLFGHHGGGFGGGYGGGEFLQGAPSETIVNNYYDSPGSERSGGDQFASDDYQDNTSSNDVDTDYDSANGDGGSDDGGGSFDDGGGSTDV